MYHSPRFSPSRGVPLLVAVEAKTASFGVVGVFIPERKVGVGGTIRGLIDTTRASEVIERVMLVAMLCHATRAYSVAVYGIADRPCRGVSANSASHDLACRAACIPIPQARRSARSQYRCRKPCRRERGTPPAPTAPLHMSLPAVVAVAASGGRVRRLLGHVSCASYCAPHP